MSPAHDGPEGVETLRFPSSSRLQALECPAMRSPVTGQGLRHARPTRPELSPTYPLPATPLSTHRACRLWIVTGFMVLSGVIALWLRTFGAGKT